MESTPTDTRRWSREDLQRWLIKVGMSDCLPVLEKNCIASGEDLLMLSEEMIMTWTHLPLQRRRSLSSLVQGLRSSATGRGETKIKGLFETLSRRRRSIPPPIPVDYRASCPTPGWPEGESVGPQEGHCLITVVESSHIQAKVPEPIPAHDCDWGSEFDDSDSERSEQPAKDHPKKTFTSTAECSIYEQPELDLIKNSQEEKALTDLQPLRIVNRKSHRTPSKQHASQRSSLPAISHTRPFTALETNAGSPQSAGYNPRSQAAGTEGLSHSVSTREVANKLNMILANRNATGSAPAFKSPLKPQLSLQVASPPKTVERGLSALSSNGARVVGTQRHPSLVPVYPAMDDRILSSVCPTEPAPSPGGSLLAYDDLDCFAWYHGNIDRTEARHRLENDATDGAFLIRKSQSQRGRMVYDSPYSLSLMSNGKVHHLTIRRRSDKTYALGFEKCGEETFGSVEELVEYHLIRPVYLADCDRGVLLSFV